MGIASPSIRDVDPQLFDPAEFLGESLECLAVGSAEERGAVYTRREVVEFILDLVGYTSDKKLHQMKMLEPSFGNGDFLEVIVDRLLQSWDRDGKADFSELLRALSAVEVHRDSVVAVEERILAQLSEYGFGVDEAAALTSSWLYQGDFLLKNLSRDFDFVVGNPPYVRQEMIPGELLTEYRRRFSTMYDRADLYVPFLEKALDLLKQGGALGFICSDRWMKNRYGGPLRDLVTRDFHLKFYVDMVGTAAFTSDVIAYPAITVIERAKSGETRVAHRPEVTRSALASLASDMLGNSPGGSVRVVERAPRGSEPWLLEADGLEGLALVRRLERELGTLEERGCKVGIGVATGSDRVFIGRYDDLDVEPSRKLPLAMTRDIDSGSLKWRGLGVVNPFSDDGTLVGLEAYPRLKMYFETHEAVLRARHVAKKNNSSWYRTIDKITPELVTTPKLLIPDIKGRAHIVLDPGSYYPHHNLYFITSSQWDLRALQSVLMSGIARLFVSTYSTKMRGGFLRFQAQYLRRIRLPAWEVVAPDAREILVNGTEGRGLDLCREVVADLYKLSTCEQKLVYGTE